MIKKAVKRACVGAIVLCFVCFFMIPSGSADHGRRNKKDTSFGIHAVGLPYFKEVHELGPSIARIIIATPVWNMIETEHGIDFKKLDYAVGTLQKDGIDVVFTIMPNSRKWGAAYLFQNKKGGVEPTTHADLPGRPEQYEKAITSIVERYDGDGKEDMPGLAFAVDYYQLVNEWVWQWEGSPETYKKYLEDSNEMIKKSHPGARIILGGLTGVEFWAMEQGFDKNAVVKLGGMQGSQAPKEMSFEAFKKKQPGHVEKMIHRLEYCLKELKPYYDIIDLHLYTEAYAEMVPCIKLIKEKAPDKALWSLENAGPFYRYSTERHCQEVIKRYVVGLHLGIQKLFWSSYNPTGGWSRNFLNLSLLTGQGQKKPAYFIYKFLAFHLGDQQGIKKTAPGPGVEAYKVSRKSGDLYVVWADKGKTTTSLSLKKQGRWVRLVSFDVSGNRIKKLERRAGIQNGKVKIPVSETPIFIFL